MGAFGIVRAWAFSPRQILSAPPLNSAGQRIRLLVDVVINNAILTFTTRSPQIRFTKDLERRAYSLLNKPYRNGNLAILVRAVLDGRNTSTAEGGRWRRYW